MRRVRTAAAALLAGLLVAMGAPAAAQLVELPTKTAPAAETARPALWMVADADTTIYLFGTVHVLPSGIGWYRGDIAAALEGSQELVTEIPDADPAAMQRLLVSSAMLPRGKTLRATMEPAKRKAYEAALASQGLPAAAFDPVKPWFAAVTLSTLPLLRNGFNVESGVESVLQVRGKALGLKHGALESIAFQFGLFDSLALPVQERYLAEVVEKLPTMHGELSKMVEAWKAGSDERLAELMNADMEDPALMEALLFKRNRTWADWVKARLDRPGRVFVAVGAGHLAGRGSVQQELTKRGVRATRLQ